MILDPEIRLLELRIDIMDKSNMANVIALDKDCFDIPWSFQAYNDELLNPLFRCYIARFKDQLVGYIGLLIHQNRIIISTLAVHPTLRRKRIGSNLIKHVLDSAIEREVKEVALEVNAKNIIAQQFYKSFGFSVADIILEYYQETGEDALIMKLIL